MSKGTCAQCRYYIAGIKFCGHFKLNMTKQPSATACKLFEPREERPGTEPYRKQNKSK